ncbi:hypothetical protein D3C78_1519430 [compost metagenome]
MENGTLIRFILTGESRVDSPEQFIHSLLKSLDRVNTESVMKPTYTSTSTEKQRPSPPVHTESTTSMNVDHKPVIQGADWHTAESSGSQNSSNSTTSQHNETQSSSNKSNRRYIDF